MLKISKHKIFHWLINCRPRTNNRAELMRAWALLTLAARFAISKISIMEDSKIIIDWLKGKSSLQPSSDKAGVLEEKSIKTYKILLKYFFEHIYRKDNTEADRLSKVALIKDLGSIEYFQAIKSGVDKGSRVH